MRQCALNLQHNPLLAKLSLSAGDLIARTTLSVSPLCTIRHGIPKQQNHMWTLSTMVSHLLGLSPILRKYVWIAVWTWSISIMRGWNSLEHTSGRIHSTKLKNRILSYFPDMDAHKQGHDVVLICNEDIGWYCTEKSM